MRKFISFFSIPVLCLISSLAFADGGGGGGMGSSCRVELEDFTFMFSAYQPHLTGDKKYCTDIPGLGRTNLVLDYEAKEGSTSVGKKRIVDQRIKEMMVGVEVVRASDGKVLAEIPPKKIRSGVLDTVVDFDQKGMYELHLKMVDADGKEVGETHFPIKVGYDSGAQFRTVLVGGTVLFALLYILYLTSAGFKQQVDKFLGKLKGF